MNPFTLFKYKKPKKIHHSNFNITTDDEFFCLNGCSNKHARGHQKLNLQCINHFIQYKPLDITITYIGCIEELIEYIIYSGLMDVLQAPLTPHPPTSITCETTDNDYADSSDKNDDNTSSDDVHVSDNDDDEGYHSCSDYANNAIEDEELSDCVNNNDHDHGANALCVLPHFMTEQNIEFRQNILRSILDEEQVDYLDCGLIGDGDEDSVDDESSCIWHLCYYHKLNLNSLIIMKHLLHEESVNNYKIKFLNKL